MANRIAPPQQSSKRVRFAEANNETVLIHFNVQKDQWYSREDCKKWKGRFRYQAREFRHEGYGVLLKDSFVDPPPDVQQYITAFAQLDDERYLRGVERYASKQHDRERAALRDETIQGVLELQRNMKRQGHLSADEIAEELSILQEEYSRPARRFAERIGVADEIVALWGEDPQKADELTLQICMKESTDCASVGSSRWDSSISDSSHTNYCKPRQPTRRTSDKTVVIVVEQDLIEENFNKSLDESSISNCSKPRRRTSDNSVTVAVEQDLLEENPDSDVYPHDSFSSIPRDYYNNNKTRQNNLQSPRRPNRRTSDNSVAIVVEQELPEESPALDLNPQESCRISNGGDFHGSDPRNFITTSRNPVRTARKVLIV